MLPQFEDRNELPKIFDTLNLTGPGLEVGVLHGHYAEILRTWKGSTLYLLDPWVGRDHRYRNVTSRFANRDVKVIRGYSPIAADQFEDGFFDWIYIDAIHTFEAANADIRAWYPKIRKGGVLSGHDYLEGRRRGQYFGVKSAVNKFIAEHGLELVITKEPFPSWYTQKLI